MDFSGTSIELWVETSKDWVSLTNFEALSSCKVSYCGLSCIRHSKIHFVIGDRNGIQRPKIILDRAGILPKAVLGGDQVLLGGVVAARRREGNAAQVVLASVLPGRFDCRNCRPGLQVPKWRIEKRSSGSKSYTTFLNGPKPASFCLSWSFSNTLTYKKLKTSAGLNSDRGSRRQARCPLDYHHGPLKLNNLTWYQNLVSKKCYSIKVT